MYILADNSEIFHTKSRILSQQVVALHIESPACTVRLASSLFN